MTMAVIMTMIMVMIGISGLLRAAITQSGRELNAHRIGELSNEVDDIFAIPRLPVRVLSGIELKTNLIHSHSADLRPVNFGDRTPRR